MSLSETQDSSGISLGSKNEKQGDGDGQDPAAAGQAGFGRKAAVHSAPALRKTSYI